MSRPHHPDQCITLCPEENRVMREAWNRDPSAKQAVYILEDGSSSVKEGIFMYFTLCGFKMAYTSDSGLAYPVQKYWKDHVQLFTSSEEANLAACMNAISKVAVLRQKLEEEEAIMASLINKLSQKR